jgi:hypothetical protein
MISQFNTVTFSIRQTPKMSIFCFVGERIKFSYFIFVSVFQLYVSHKLFYNFNNVFHIGYQLGQPSTTWNNKVLCSQFSLGSL